MVTLRCCVVDDEPLAQDLIASYIERTPCAELVGKYGSAQEAIKSIMENDIDVVFLDIHMPQLNGIEFARIIPKRCCIVFTTAYDRYAVEGYKVNALDYLMKPVSYEEFLATVNKALQWVQMRDKMEEQDSQKDVMIVKSEYKLCQIEIDKILYIEGLKDYVKIYMEGEKSPIVTLMNMKSLEKYLPESSFLRVHRSFIVNTKKIKVIERNRIVFGSTYIPVSDSYKNAFNAYISSFLLMPTRENPANDE